MPIQLIPSEGWRNTLKAREEAVLYVEPSTDKEGIKSTNAGRTCFVTFLAVVSQIVLTDRPPRSPEQSACFVCFASAHIAHKTWRIKHMVLNKTLPHIDLC